ncbi:PREDICTED: uncharacterized protein LOC109235869 [Nicotiana attenuata]|uniref:uncharacterized protein LOC109235869 n=1 Tax=Nicotiana attenuata TaxID=49451 RepID=UPI0009050CB3|nr:PREDICTED: uncharacterized protein LOC109235869 [Nicotiana attenuata]
MEIWPTLPARSGGNKTPVVTWTTSTHMQKDLNSKGPEQKQIQAVHLNSKTVQSGNANETVTQNGGAQRKLQLESEQKVERTWSMLFEENKLAKRGMDLNFVPPTLVEGEVIVELVQEDIDSEIHKWKYAAIVYVIGGSPSIWALERFVAGQGNFSTKPKIYYHNAGYFMIKFSCLEERDMVMYSGPHMLNNRPVIMKAWTADFDFDAEDLKTIPIWIKLPNLPLSCWSASALSKIGSGLGQPIYADACTSNAERISYARILVEVDVTKELPTVIK